MKNRARLMAALLLAMMVTAGCAPGASPGSGTQNVELTAGRTANVAGGRGQLYFGGFPDGAMIVFSCEGEDHSLSSLGEGESSEELCGITVTLLGYGKSNMGNDAASFEVSW